MKYFPLRIYIAFSLFSIAALYITPLKYKNLQSTPLIIFLSVYLLTFCWGFLLGSHTSFKFPERAKLLAIRRKQHIQSLDLLARSYQKTKTVLNVSLTLSAIYWIVEWGLLLSSGRLLDGLSIGDAYVSAYETYERGTSEGGIKFFYDTIFLSFTTLSIVIGLYFIPILKSNTRHRLYFVMLSYVVVSLLSYGKQKYLGDLIIFGLTAYMINAAIFGKTFHFKRIALAVLAGLTLTTTFSWILHQRYTAAGIGPENIAELLHPLSFWDESNFLFWVFPEWVIFPLSMFLNYFANGLYGLSLALQLPFEWTYFIGNSYSFTRIVEIFFLDGGAIFNKTYPIRVDSVFGWDFSKWFTIFPWLAGDFTFFGVIPVSFAFAFIYGRLWIRSVRIVNPYSGPLFIFLSLGLVFSYANNQIFHGLHGIIVFLFLSTLYILHSGSKHSKSLRS